MVTLYIQGSIFSTFGFLSDVITDTCPHAKTVNFKRCINDRIKCGVGTNRKHLFSLCTRCLCCKTSHEKLGTLAFMLLEWEEIDNNRSVIGKKNYQDETKIMQRKLESDVRFKLLWEDAAYQNTAWETCSERSKARINSKDCKRARGWIQKNSKDTESSRRHQREGRELQYAIRPGRNQMPSTLPQDCKIVFPPKCDENTMIILGNG